MLSVLIIAKNAQDKIENCLKSVKGLGDEVVLLDNYSTDNTVKIAKKYGARIFTARGNNYSAWRNEAAKHARGDWLFYIDHDEEVTPELFKEIENSAGPAGSSSHSTSSAGQPAVAQRDALRSRHPLVAYRIPRKNYVFGKWLKHGGFWPDYVLRLMRKDALQRWEGELHEQPIIKGEVGTLQNTLIHHKEDSLSEMLGKTNRYSVFEAKLLYQAKHPAVTWWRFFRIMLGELWYRLFVKDGILDGPEGFIYGVYQMWSRFVTYAKLWEMQQHASK